jgi:hypothetical protein
MQPVPKPLRMQVFSYKHLGLCILCPYPAHIEAAGSFVVDVHWERQNKAMH